MIVDEMKLVDERRGTFDGFVEGRVCEACNSGWMSRLERAAEPLLVALGEKLARRLSELTDNERLTLARWAAKTAYMLNSASNFPLKIPKEHLRALVGTGAPIEGVVLYAAQPRLTPKLGWLQGPIWRVESARNAELKYDKLAHASYKVTLRIGSLLLLVVYWPAAGWRHILASNDHRRIWPRQGSILVYPGPASLLESSSLLDVDAESPLSYGFTADLA